MGGLVVSNMPVWHNIITVTHGGTLTQSPPDTTVARVCWIIEKKVNYHFVVVVFFYLLLI